MGPETMEAPTHEQAEDRLELKHRNALQHEVMRQMLGDNPPQEDEIAWVVKYGGQVSELMDYHEHDDIRDMAVEENYQEAAKLLIELLV